MLLTTEPPGRASLQLCRDPYYVGTVVCMKRDAIIYSFMIKLTNKVSTELKIKIQVPILFVISAMSGRKYGTKRLFP